MRAQRQETAKRREDVPASHAIPHLDRQCPGIRRRVLQNNEWTILRAGRPQQQGPVSPRLSAPGMPTGQLDPGALGFPFAREKNPSHRRDFLRLTMRAQNRNFSSKMLEDPKRLACFSSQCRPDEAQGENRRRDVSES